MAKRGSYTLDSEFYCTLCGSRGIPIARRGGRKRESGHLKKLFCISCEAETNHVEIELGTHYSKKDFDFEFKNHNFDNKGNRILPYGLFRAKMHHEGKELP